MCNLYRLNSKSDEIAKLFGARDTASGANIGLKVYPGYPGLVIASGDLRSMSWGFPLTLKSKATGKLLKPKPVNNARADKLESFFWRDSFYERRCLIPLSASAEAEGPKGRKTQTWLSLPDREAFVVAGIWCDSEEWGPVYSMVMTNADGPTAEVHNRMPVILSGDELNIWENGSTKEADALCRPFQGEVAIDQTPLPWTKA